MKTILAGIGYGLSGVAQVSVVEKGRVVKTFDPIHNLIMNQGLDQIASNRINSCWAYGVAGTGTTVTELDSAADTCTITAGAVLLSSIGYLTGTSADVGKTIKLDTSGNNYRITAFGSTTACTVSPADTIGPDTFILYNTNQVGLDTEVKRTSTYLTGLPNCQTVTIINTTTCTRTFDFSAEAGPIGYNEIGFSPSASAGSNIFSRIKLPSTVNLIAGQQLRVKYSVSTSVTPYVPQIYGVSPIVGWASATGQMQAEWIPMWYVDSSGNITSGNNTVDGKYYSGYGDPGENNGFYGRIYISTDATALRTYGGGYYNLAGTTANQQWAQSSYVAGSYTRDKFITFAVGEANRADWRSFGLGEYNGNTTVMRYIFDTVQTKLSTYTLTLGFRATWNRVL
jgi:hypothetical protein